MPILLIGVLGIYSLTHLIGGKKGVEFKGARIATDTILSSRNVSDSILNKQERTPKLQIETDPVLSLDFLKKIEKQRNFLSP